MTGFGLTGKRNDIHFHEGRSGAIRRLSLVCLRLAVPAGSEPHRLRARVRLGIFRLRESASGYRPRPGGRRCMRAGARRRCDYLMAGIPAPHASSKGVLLPIHRLGALVMIARSLRLSDLTLRAAWMAFVLLAFLVVLASVYGAYPVARQAVSGLLLGSIYMIVAVSFTLTIGILNFLNFTIPTLFMLTGMVAWALIADGYVKFAGGWAWLVALCGGVIVAVAASLLVERFTFRYLKMRHSDATEHAIPLVSSLGFLLIFQHLVLIAMGSEAQRFSVPFKSDIHVAGLILGIPQIVSFVLAVSVVAALSFIVKNTAIGRALRTIAESPDTASLLGVEIGRVVPVVFILSGLLAGIAGALFTVNYGNVSAFMGSNVGDKAIAAMVVGGIGSIWGAIAGGLVIGLVETFVIYLLGGDSVQMAVWGLLLVFIVVRPRGLFGTASVGKGKL
jgi:branched-chain amino acid transport system permease protein